ncbi:serine/threonine protein kinase, partial [Actinosynnema sp. NPDC059335]
RLPAVLVAVVLWPRAAPPDALPPVVGAAEPTIELDEPIDLGDRVSLTWTASDDRLYFAVRYWAEGEPGRTEAVGFGRSATVTVDPDRGYCFLVRATEGGDRVFESRTVRLRDAVCHR